MMARALPSIRLTDLDRDELLQLLADRPFVAASLSTADMLSARWDVATRRAREARAAEAPVSAAYWAVARGVDPTTMSERAWRALLKVREAKRLAYDAARRRVKRAEAAEDRAWKAYQAHCDQKRASA